MIKLWIDDIRKPPSDYKWITSVNDAIEFISSHQNDIELIDIDHDAGDYASQGGDYIAILDWLEINQLSYPIHIHSMNVIGVMNMRRIIKKNNWTEVT